MVSAAPPLTAARPSRNRRWPREDPAARKIDPFSSAVAGVRPSRRTVHQIEPNTTMIEIAQPAARLTGNTCKVSIGVPTAGSHRVRRPSIMKAA